MPNLIANDYLMHLFASVLKLNSCRMKNKKTNEGDKTNELNKKLENIIEQSKAENEALKKLLNGLEKLEKRNDKKTGNKNKRNK